MVPERAIAAMAELDGTFFQGRLIHIIPGRPSRASKRQSSGTCNVILAGVCVRVC